MIDEISEYFFQIGKLPFTIYPYIEPTQISKIKLIIIEMGLAR